MDIHKKVELQRAIGKPAEKAPCRICKLIRVYLLFAIPTLALFWLGVDFGVGDIDAQDLVVKGCAFRTFLVNYSKNIFGFFQE